MDELTTAEALLPKEPERALEHLVRAFRSSRDPKIAELVERLSESLLNPSRDCRRRPPRARKC